MPSFRIAVIAGDGIGREVIPAGLAAIEAAARGSDVTLSITEFPWGCEFYLKHHRMLDEDAFDRLAPFDAIYLGAIGAPTVPDHISAGDMILPLRKRFDQYVNLRPMRLLPGLVSPLANRGRRRHRHGVRARTPKASTRPSEDGCTSARRTKSPSRPASSRATASSASSGTRSRSPRSGRAGCSRARRNRTRCATAWCCGTRSRKT